MRLVQNAVRQGDDEVVGEKARLYDDGDDLAPRAAAPSPFRPGATGAAPAPWRRR